jgi:hypothetical protein
MVRFVLELCRDRLDRLGLFQEDMMGQINNSQPTHPVITFKVSLPTQQLNDWCGPEKNTSYPDMGRQSALQQAANRICWFPGKTCGDNLYHRDGDTFTLYGLQAQYYRTEIAKGNFPELSIVATDTGDLTTGPAYTTN